MVHRTRLTATVWMLVTSLLLLSSSTASEPDSPAPPPLVRESFRFDPGDPLVLIPVRVGGKDCLFAVDTGFTVSVFDVSLRSHLGTRTDSERMYTPNGDMRFDVYTAPHAQVGSLPLTDDRVVCHDLTSIRELMGRDFYGIVGIDFLKAWIVAIDFDEGRCDILSPETNREFNWGTPIPFCYGPRGTIYVLATVGDDVTTYFKIDTGHTGTGSLEESLLSRFVRSRKANVTGDTEAMAVSGTMSAKVVRLSHLSVGSFQHENLRFQSSRENVLGLRYLSRYRVTIDFPNKRLYLARGKHFADPETGNTCGLGCLFRSGHLVVCYVDRRSPAHGAGLQPGDVIVSLSGKPVSEWTSGEIRDVLSTEGKTVQLTVERDGRQIEVSFTPKEYD